MSFIKSLGLDKHMIDIFGPPIIIGNASNTKEGKRWGDLGFLNIYPDFLILLCVNNSFMAG